MLPGFSGRMSKCLVIGGTGIGEGAADLAEDIGRRDRVGPGISILQQWGQAVAGMRMRDGTAERPPEPLDAIGVRVVGGV